VAALLLNGSSMTTRYKKQKKLRSCSVLVWLASFSPSLFSDT